MPDYEYVVELADYIDEEELRDGISLGPTDAEIVVRALRHYAATRCTVAQPTETPEAA